MKFSQIIKLSLLVSLTFDNYTSRAQEFYESKEYGVLLGGSTYFGDLNPNYGVKHIRPSGGLFFKYHVNPYVSVRTMINYTQVGYDDKYSSNEYQLRRNLNFKSNIFEAAVLGEFNFFWFSTGDLSKRRYTPYLAGGVGLFYYNPYTVYDGRKRFLRPLGTEGQKLEEFADRKYKNYSVCFPVGVGIKYWLRPGVNLGFEILNRFTLTDYMDDVSNTYIGMDKFVSNPGHSTLASVLQDPSVSIDGNKLGVAGKQRGDNATKDQYLMVQFSISFQLKTYKCPSHLKGIWEP